MPTNGFSVLNPAKVKNFWQGSGKQPRIQVHVPSLSRGLTDWTCGVGPSDRRTLSLLPNHETLRLDFVTWRRPKDARALPADRQATAQRIRARGGGGGLESPCLFSLLVCWFVCLLACYTIINCVLLCFFIVCSCIPCVCVCYYVFDCVQRSEQYKHDFLLGVLLGQELACKRT